MNKMIKKLTVGILGLTLCGILVPVVKNTTYASESTLEKVEDRLYSTIDTYNYQYISKLPEETAKKYKDALYLSLKDRYLSKDSFEVVLDNIDKMAAKDNGMIVIENKANFWDGQGVTTGELGAIIDALLIVATGGSSAGAKIALNTLIKRMGMQGVINLVRNKLVEIGLGGIAGFVQRALPLVIKFSSPGKGLAEFIDSWDFYPNNGRINAWK